VRYGCLYNYLTGSTIAWEDYAMDRLKSLGHTMAKAQLIWGIKLDGFLKVTDEYISINDRMQRYFHDDNVVKAVTAKLGVKLVNTDFSRSLKIAGKLPEQQVLHMDFVRSNILFNGKMVCGILDFEKPVRQQAVGRSPYAGLFINWL